MTGDSEQAAAEQLARKLNRLFEVVHPPHRGPYSNREVERWLSEQADDGAPTVSANYLSFLRRAQRTNPTSNSLRAIARFFDIDPGYLLADDERAQRIDEQLEALSLLANANVRGIAARASGLEPAAQSWVLQMLETMPQARRQGAQPEPAADNDVDAGAADDPNADG